MKKANQLNNQFIFAIYAGDKKGLVGQIMIYFNRSNYHVKSMNVSRTDISDLVLITLEAEVPEAALSPFKEELKKIIEGYAVSSYPAGEGLKKTGFYRLAAAALNNQFWAFMAKYGAVLSRVKVRSSAKWGAIRIWPNCIAYWKGRFCSAFAKAG